LVDPSATFKICLKICQFRNAFLGWLAVRDQLSVLRIVPYRRLLLSRVSTLLGTSAAPIALAFAVLPLPGSAPTNLGLVMLGRSATQLAFLLFGGVLADRLPRYRLMISAELVAGLSQSAAAALVLTGNAAVASLMLLSAVNGAAAAVFLPASGGIMPQLVPKDRLQPANGLMGIASNSSNILGAALASVVVAAFGPGWALALDAASFLVSAWLLTGTKVSRTERVHRGSVLGDLLHGWREFSSRAWIWVVVAQFALLNACTSGAFKVLGPIVADRRMGGAAAWGAIMAAQAAGWVAGSVVAMRIKPRHPILVAVLVTFSFAFPSLLMGLGAPVAVVATASLVGGVCGTMHGVLWETSLQTNVPTESLSRIASYDAFGSFVLGPVALAVVGPIAEVAGVVPTLIGAGFLAMVTTAAGLLSTEVRTMRLAEPESAAVPAPAEG
jgi:hypothetical protein